MLITARLISVLQLVGKLVLNAGHFDWLTINDPGLVLKFL
jgi:hypothetical protein